MPSQCLPDDATSTFDVWNVDYYHSTVDEGALEDCFWGAINGW